MNREPTLAGLRVVEIGQYIAAPFAATLFADQGAEVVKIERPGGDPYRKDAARFAAWNRGKTSVVLDLASADGRAEALELIRGADAVIENLRPGALARLGLDLHDLRVRQPELVTCSISAYGSDGPSRDDPGWEPLVHAPRERSRDCSPRRVPYGFRFRWRASPLRCWPCSVPVPRW